MLTAQQQKDGSNARLAGEIPPSLTEDGFLGGRVKVLQPEKGYRAGIDAVFLAASIPIEPGQTALEAGYGVGVVSLCVAARVAGVHITGVEIASRYSILAEENIKKVECIDYPELGMEAVWQIEVENFPAFILVDDKGNDFFKGLGL